jgi:2-oxoacid:acceptor oxidoreductase gamma subunit (pyruvate/2-ketoisovalerate family)
MALSVDKGTIEIRWHGRGGQGTVTAAKMFASVAVKKGFYGQSIPMFGLERSGTPVAVYSRVSKETIQRNDPVKHPDIVVITDPSVMVFLAASPDGKLPESIPDPRAGITDETIFIINSPMSPEEAKKVLGLEGKPNKVCTLDATKIALEEIGRNVPNTAILGAMAKIIPEVVDMETVKEELEESFGASSKLKALIPANLKAMERGYNEVRCA